MNRIKCVVLSLLLSCFSLDVIFCMEEKIASVVQKSEDSQSNTVQSDQKLNALGSVVYGTLVIGYVLVSLIATPKGADAVVDAIDSTSRRMFTATDTKDTKNMPKQKKD